MDDKKQKVTREDVFLKYCELIALYIEQLQNDKHSTIHLCAINDAMRVILSHGNRLL